jgi:hypothetical protein
MIAKQPADGVIEVGNSVKRRAAMVSAQLSRRVSNDIIEGFLLPRYAIKEMLSMSNNRRCLLIQMAVFLLFVAGSAALLALSCDYFALLTAFGAYFVIALSVCFSKGESKRYTIMFWLLRLPASVAIGSLMLMTIQDWPCTIGNLAASQSIPQFLLWLAIPIILIAALIYLMLEVYGHGVSGWQTGTRSMQITIMTFFHAVGVNVMMFETVYRLFADNGMFTSILAEMSIGARLLILLLSSAVCAVIGIFTQNIWDSAAITSPIQLMKWRKR